MPIIQARTALLAAMIGCAAPLWAHGPAAPTAQPSALPPAARAPAAVVDRFHDALRRGDTATAAAQMANEALIFEAGGVERSKQEYAAHHLGADAAFSKAVPSKITQRSGAAFGNLAWIASEGRTTGTFNGKAVDRITAETMVLKRVGGAWKIIHIHWSSAAGAK